MISRATVAVDRLAAFLAAVVLIAGGAAAIIWWFHLVGGLPRSIDVSALDDATTRSWWPWAAAVLGLLLVVVGLRWLVAHLPRRSVGHLTLPGSDRSGRLRVAARPLAAAAAASLATADGVTSSSGQVRRERGELVAALRATITPDADLEAVAQAADRTARDLARVLERDDVRCVVRLRVASAGTTPRVR